MELTQNTIVQGDQIQILERLPDSFATLIFFNPPKGVFFNWVERESNLREFNGFLMKSFQQIFRVLKDDGTLYLDLDSDSDETDIRFILGQIFKRKPVREFTMPSHTSNGHRRRGKRNNTILVYAKGNQYVMNEVSRPMTVKEISLWSTDSDSKGIFRVESLFGPGDYPKMKFSWHGITPPDGRIWRCSKSILDGLFATGEVYISENNRPQIKRYKEPNLSVGDFWDDLTYPGFFPMNASSLNRFQQSVQFFERILKFGSNHNDRVLNLGSNSSPFCVAADHLQRNWTTIIQTLDFMEPYITIQKEPYITDYQIISEEQILLQPIVFQNYDSIFSNMSQIEELKIKVEQFDQQILTIKQELNLEGDDPETILTALQNKIDETGILGTPEIRSKYIEIARAWLVDWNRLEKLTQEFLPSGEFLLDLIQQTQSNDYSPFIIQYCRALENEILCKVFETYNDDINERILDISNFLALDIQNEIIKKFAKSIKSKNKKYTLGEMTFILKLLNPKSRTFGRSPLLHDFRKYILNYFQEEFLEVEYLAQISTITEDFRNKAAHPGLLDLRVALECQKAVRETIIKFLLTYKSTEFHEI